MTSFSWSQKVSHVVELSIFVSLCLIYCLPKWKNEYKLDHYFKKINVRAKIIKLLVENIREDLYNFGFGNRFLHMKIKTEGRKEKIGKLDFIKIKISYASKDIIKK